MNFSLKDLLFLVDLPTLAICFAALRVPQGCRRQKSQRARVRSMGKEIAAATPHMLRMSLDPDRPTRTSPRSRLLDVPVRRQAVIILAAATSCTSAEQSMTAPSGSRCAPSLVNSLDTSPAAGSYGTL